MNDVEEVISDLDLQIRWIEEIKGHEFPGWLNVTNAMRNAIALLTKVTPKEPKNNVFWHLCGACNQLVERSDKYCPNCGKPILWKGR